MKRIIALMSVLVFAAVAAKAIESTSDQGQAKAEIVAAATLTHDEDAILDFGKIVRDTDGGTVTIPVTEDGKGTQTTSGINVVDSNQYEADHFLLENLDTSLTYTIGGDTTVILTGPGTPMTVTLSKAPSTTITGVESKDIYVGGILQVGANQTAGVYTGSYTLTVTY